MNDTISMARKGRRSLARLFLIVMGWAVLVIIPWRLLRPLPNNNNEVQRKLQKDQTDIDVIKRQILEASKYMPPPFDTLLSDDSSPLFAKIMRNWNETMHLVNSKADVFTPLILKAVESTEQVLQYAWETWSKVNMTNDEGNVTAGGGEAAPIYDAFQGFPTHTLFFDWLEQRANVSSPEVYSGHYNANWGLFSTTFPNQRTVNWNTLPRDPRWKDIVTDNPNVVAFFTVQHHNVSDPELDSKVLSLPLGGFLSDSIYDHLKERSPGLLRDRDYDITVAGRPYDFRVEAFCHLIDNNGFPRPERDLSPMDTDDFMHILSISKYIWTPPGLGTDCYRNWETLLSGAIPILERGFGLERTFAFLPSFWIDSYFHLTPDMLENAYPVFVALRNEFDFTRLGNNYWIKLIQKVASEKSADLLLVQHPFAKQRIVWPSDNEGRGTNVKEGGAFRYCNSTNNFENKKVE